MFDEHLIFFPERAWIDHPRTLAQPFQDIWLPLASGIKLHAWLIGHDSHSQVIIFFHGNAGNISHRLDRLRWLGQLNVRWLLLDYPGYGQSEGRASEQGTYDSAHAAYHYVRHELNIAPENIFLWGESLGGAVAIELASTTNVAGLALESTFTSIQDMANIHYPWIPPFLVRDRYPSLKRLTKIQAPVLIAHGDQDDIVPFAMAQSLFASAPEPKHFFVISGAHHNNTYDRGGESYRHALMSFFSQPLLVGSNP